MKKTLSVALIVTLVLAMGQTKHIHPRSIVQFANSETLTEDIDGIPIDVFRNIKPTRFVPINSVLFFKTYTPCEEGFERDILGVCREVW